MKHQHDPFREGDLVVLPDGQLGTIIARPQREHSIGWIVEPGGFFEERELQRPRQIAFFDNRLASLTRTDRLRRERIALNGTRIGKLFNWCRSIAAALIERDTKTQKQLIALEANVRYLQRVVLDLVSQCPHPINTTGFDRRERSEIIESADRLKKQVDRSKPTHLTPNTWEDLS
jgi:hypothetical protein